MDEPHTKATNMEVGEAGYNTISNSSTVCEASESKSPTPDSSTEPPQPSQTQCCKTFDPPTRKAESGISGAPRWFNIQWDRLRSSWIGKWASHPQRDRFLSSVRKLKSCPTGYPNLAAFLDSDESFMVYRRFGFLQSRLLLDKQDELRELEDALDRLDRREARQDPKRPMTRDLTEDQWKPRMQLLEVIERKFCSYANLLDASRKMVALNRPSKGDYESVKTYIENNQPLMEAEASWVKKREDLVTLRPGREHAWLDASIEKLLKWFRCGLLERIFGDERSRQKSSDLEVYYSRDQISRLANCIITFIVLVLLVVPIYLLYHFINDVQSGQRYAICMGILIVATLAFSAALSLFTRAKRHEILAAAAAYCAVLVVFLGNAGPRA